MQDLRGFSVPKGFRGGNVIKVQLWWAVQATLFSWSPQVLYRRAGKGGEQAEAAKHQNRHNQDFFATDAVSHWTRGERSDGKSHQRGAHDRAERGFSTPHS